MFNWLIPLLITNVISIGGWIQTFKANKRKANADASITEQDVDIKKLSATEQIVNIYNKMSTDLREDYERRYANCTQEIKDLTDLVTELKQMKCENKTCPNRI